MMMMGLILYSAASVPVRVCFFAHAEGMQWAFEVVMSVLTLIYLCAFPKDKRALEEDID